MTRDTEFHGVQLKKGDMVYALVSGANRDPRAYERAGEFVIDRQRNNHMGFANGPHRCLGAHLARRELQPAVEEWPRVIPDFHVATAEELEERGGRAMMTLTNLAAGVGGAVVKLTVDGASCMGHGRCYLMAPDLLTDDEGLRRARRPGRGRPRTRRVPAPSRRSPFSRERTRRRRRSDPSGFYAADQLLKQDIAVDVFDALPTPYGLARAGVAPDHPTIKSLTRMYDRTAQHPDFRLFGGVELGVEVTAGELLERYHALVYAVGTPTDNRLGIPGDERPGSVAATRFVAWHNGHPGHAEEAFDLSCSRAVVIGNGNVALDVARMLVLEPDELASTDTADHALAGFAAAAVNDVVVLGRRGPAQAAFTNPELRELGELARADVVVDPAELEVEHDDHTPNARRNLAMLREFAVRAPAGRSHRIELRFYRSPVEILGDGDGPVTGVRVARNRLENGRALPTGEEEVIPCGLAIRSIGYRGRPLPGVPFDERRGLIRNDGGRVCEEDGTPRVGEYAVGWIKRGPSGVIGTNKKCAADTVAALLEDRARGRLNEPPAADGAAIEAWLRTRVPALVTWHGWQAIDEHERGRGEPEGRPRIKLVRIPEMLDVAGSRAA